MGSPQDRTAIVLGLPVAVQELVEDGGKESDDMKIARLTILIVSVTIGGIAVSVGCAPPPIPGDSSSSDFSHGDDDDSTTTPKAKPKASGAPNASSAPQSKGSPTTPSKPTGKGKPQPQPQPTGDDDSSFTPGPRAPGAPAGPASDPGEACFEQCVGQDPNGDACFQILDSCEQQFPNDGTAQSEADDPMVQCIQQQDLSCVDLFDGCDVQCGSFDDTTGAGP
jgi:hypothetical protein